ncbi:MAG TPA: OPT/YSL family transporter, partial [Tepidisphaeraceae bacterium]|nr:OPT/YSL family transporter [Tepidisphaeraceae bacterium]
IGAFAIQFFGNAWATGGLADLLGQLGFDGIAQSPARQGIVPNSSPPQHYFSRFIEGMSISQVLPNQMFVWMPVFIGGMVAAGLLNIVSSPKQLVSTFRGLLQTGRATRQQQQEETISILPLMMIFVSSVVGAIILFRILIPDFPWYIIGPFALFWSLLFSLIDIRAIGTTGYRVEPPYVREGLIVSMKPKNINVWFAPWPVALGSSSWVQNFKTAELVGCRPRSLIVAFLLAYPVGMLANLLFVSIFWSIAPIPSAVYPYAEIVLPVWANNLCIWMSAAMPNASEGTRALVSQLFNLEWMFGTFAIFTTIFVLGKFFKRFEISLIGLAVGMVMPLPFAMSLFIGGLVARYIRGKTGPQWFAVNRNIIVAGLAVGEGVVIGLFAAIAALKNSLIALPY